MASETLWSPDLVDPILPAGDPQGHVTLLLSETPCLVTWCRVILLCNVGGKTTWRRGWREPRHCYFYNRCEINGVARRVTVQIKVVSQICYYLHLGIRLLRTWGNWGRWHISGNFLDVWHHTTDSPLIVKIKKLSLTIFFKKNETTVYKILCLNIYIENYTP